MRLTGKNTSLVGSKGETPPLPFIEVDADEGDRLVALGYATDLDNPEKVEPKFELIEEPAAPTAEEPEAAEPAAPAEVSKEASPSEPAAAPPSVGVTDGESSAAARLSPAAAEDDPAAPDAATTRLREIADHIHLLTDDDLVKTGARAGKPKLDILATSLGYPVTSDEVDAALAMDPAA